MTHALTFSLSEANILPSAFGLKRKDRTLTTVENKKSVQQIAGNDLHREKASRFWQKTLKLKSRVRRKDLARALNTLDERKRGMIVAYYGLTTGQCVETRDIERAFDWRFDPSSRRCAIERLRKNLAPPPIPTAARRMFERAEADRKRFEELRERTYAALFGAGKRPRQTIAGFLNSLERKIVRLEKSAAVLKKAPLTPEARAFLLQPLELADIGGSSEHGFRQAGIQVWGEVVLKAQDWKRRRYGTRVLPFNRIGELKFRQLQLFLAQNGVSFETEISEELAAEIRKEAERRRSL